MGYGTRNGSIQTFYPDDTKTDLYIETRHFGIDLAEIWKKIQAKWPGIEMSELEMEADYIQTDCLGYDLYDSSDYTNFIHITAYPDYFSRIEDKKSKQA